MPGAKLSVKFIDNFIPGIYLTTEGTYGTVLVDIFNH